MSKLTSQLLGIAIAGLQEPNREAMAEIQKQLEENDGQIALSRGGAIMLLEEADMTIGIHAIRFGAHEIRYDSVTKASPSVCEKRTQNGIALNVLENGDVSMITVSGHVEGMRLLRSNLSEAVDVFGVQAHLHGTPLTFSTNYGLTCENLEPAGMLINEHGMALDNHRIIAWEQMKAIDTTQSVSIALRDKRMVTISSC